MATLVRSMRCCTRLFITKIKPICKGQSQLFRFQENVRAFHRVSALLSGRKYSDKHEWVTMQDDVGTIGISDYAQEALGDIVYVQLPEVDVEFDQDDECGTLESVKAASELYTPVSGTVVEINSEVEDTPALINTSPYEKGWLYKMKLKEPSELDGLMDEDQYQQFLKDQE